MQTNSATGTGRVAAGPPTGEGQPDAYGDMRPNSFGVALPVENLRVGVDAVQFASLGGSWIGYDTFAVQRTQTGTSTPSGGTS